LEVNVYKIKLMGSYEMLVKRFEGEGARALASWLYHIDANVGQSTTKYLYLLKHRKLRKKRK